MNTTRNILAGLMLIACTTAAWADVVDVVAYEQKAVNQTFGNVTISWKATVKNNSTTADMVTLTIQMLDAEGFEIYSTIEMLQQKKGTRGEHTGTFTIPAETLRKVKQTQLSSTWPVD